MSSKSDKNNLKVIFAEIINGYSSLYFKDFPNLRIKHLTNIDSSNIDLFKHRYYEKAKEDGLPTEPDRLEELDEDKTWTREDEKFLYTQENYIKNLEHTKSKLFLERDMKEIREKIERGEKTIIEKRIKRKDLIGFTAEEYSEKKVDDYYFHFSLTNANGGNYFSVGEMDELDTEDLNKIKKEYQNKMKSFDGQNIKRIAVSPFFLNFYLLCDGDPFTFYGKAIVHLSYFQAEIMSHGRRYKNLIENAKVDPPDYLYESPDDLIEYLEGTTGNNPAEASEKSQDKDATMIIGATDADMKKMGVEKPRKAQNLAAQAAAKGGSLNMQDLMKMHGVK